jgi:hypothetical protein
MEEGLDVLFALIQNSGFQKNHLYLRSDNLFI